MKILIILCLLSSYAIAAEKTKVLKAQKNSKTKVVAKDLPKEIAKDAKKEDCDTKEDILKKLEEEKKKKEQSFSLQGGNTGCSLDKK